MILQNINFFSSNNKCEFDKFDVLIKEIKSFRNNVGREMFCNN